MCGVDLSSHVLAVAVVVACLSLSVGGGDAYVLPDDVVQPTLTDHHHHHSQGKTSAGGLEVAVEPEFVVMRHSRPVHISCAASTTTKQRLYLSFFVSTIALSIHATCSLTISTRGIEDKVCPITFCSVYIQGGYSGCLTCHCVTYWRNYRPYDTVMQRGVDPEAEICCHGFFFFGAKQTNSGHFCNILLFEEQISSDHFGPSA